MGKVRNLQDMRDIEYWSAQIHEIHEMVSHFSHLLEITRESDEANFIRDVGPERAMRGAFHQGIPGMELLPE
jgi:hypothetical protein